MENQPQIQWSTSRFVDKTLEQAYREDSWRSVRLVTALTLILVSLAWLASLSLDNNYLKGTPYFIPVAGSRTCAGIGGILIGLWLLLTRPVHGHWLPRTLVYLWMFLYAATGIIVAWAYPFLETTADGRTDLLLSTCYWMSIQALGLGIALSAWRRGIILFAAAYASSFIIQAIYWAPLLEHTLEGQIIIIVTACFFAVAMPYLFARRSRQRFAITKLYEEAKVVAEKAQQFSSFLLAATGHDIRQPIFALNLNASMLEDLINERDWTRAAKLAERQRRALSGVSGLISSVLELSHLDTNRRQITPEPLQIGAVIEFVLEPVLHMAMDRGIDIRSVPSSRRVDADRGVVEHILANLVANAVSHSGADRVLIGAKSRGEFVEVMVIDDGKGLSDETRTLTLADIQPGQDRAASRGLGIEIMFRLAEKAGLDLTLSSVPGRGVAASLKCPALK